MMVKWRAAKGCDECEMKPTVVHDELPSADDFHQQYHDSSCLIDGRIREA
jgi:hypothetical protein